MEESRDFKGVWISKEIWLSEDLNAIDKIILTEIDSLDNENHCIAGNEYFAKFCQCSEVTVSRSIAKLIKLGYITKLSFNGRTRKLKSNLRIRCIKTIDQTYQNDKADLSKRQAINIYNNISNIKEKINKKEVKSKNSKSIRYNSDYNFCTYSDIQSGDPLDSIVF